MLSTSKISFVHGFCKNLKRSYRFAWYKELSGTTLQIHCVKSMSLPQIELHVRPGMFLWIDGRIICSVSHKRQSRQENIRSQDNRRYRWKALLTSPKTKWTFMTESSLPRRSYRVFRNLGFPKKS